MQPAAVQLIQEIYEGFARRDLAAIFSRFAPEIEIVQSAELPWGGTYRGHDGAREFVGKLTRHINSSVQVERMICAGEHVIAVGWTRGVTIATGARFDVPVAHVWKVREGLVTQVQFFIDNPTMLSALAGAPAK